jgi:hypothetical protein
MSELDPGLLLSLVAAKAAIEAALVQLAGEVEAEAAPPDPEETPIPQDVCQHKQRTTIKSFGTKEHWRCQTCGYEYIRR